MRKCPSYTNGGKKFYHCYYHILVYNPKEEGEEAKSMNFGLEIIKKTLLKSLKEGEIERGTVARE